MLDVGPAVLAGLGLGLTVWRFNVAAVIAALAVSAATVATALGDVDRSGLWLLLSSLALIAMVFVLARRGAFAPAAFVAVAEATSVAPERAAESDSADVVVGVGFWALGPQLGERFAAAGPAQVHVALDREAARAVSAQVAATGYRIVVEALTNVRRHAPDATDVHVVVRAQGRDLAVSVTDYGSGEAAAQRRSGGLAGLEERVAALGGTLEAGPAEPAGWQVRAVLPR